MRAYPKAVESYQKVRVVVSNIRARQMAQVPQLLQCSTVTPLLLIWLCTALIATVAEPYKVVDQSLKIDPMPVRNCKLAMVLKVISVTSDTFQMGIYVRNCKRKDQFCWLSLPGN